MINFIIENAATVIIGLVLAGLAALALVKIFKDKRKGSACASCSSKDNCPGCLLKTSEQKGKTQKSSAEEDAKENES